MTDYSQGKIYVIKSSQTEDIYIGSTKMTLDKRFDVHKSDYKRYLEGKTHYVTSFEILHYEDAYIELLENYPCETKEELNKKEGEYQRKLECVNKNIAGRTYEEYCEENKDKRKEWKENHKEYLKEYSKEYHSRPDVKEHIKEYREANEEHIKEHRKEYNSRPDVKEHRKEYLSRPDVKEYIKEYSKEYRSRPDVKERDKEYRKTIMKCVCGKEFATGNRSRHMKSKVHIKYIEDMKEMGDQQNLDELFEQFKFKIE